MTPEEQYTKVCGPSLEEIKQESKEARRQIAEVREKVFNGFGVKINIQFWLIGVILAGIFGLFFRSF